MSSKMNCDCPICYDKYTAQLRKPIKCQYCDFTACLVCLKKYLVEGLLDAHCMECKREWNDDFLDMNFTKAFRLGAWKKHREDVLLDREMALLPTRQLRVEATIKAKEVKKEYSELHKRIEELDKKRLELQRKSDVLVSKYNRHIAESQGREYRGGNGEKEEEKAKFIMKCPDVECRGFLSTAYKCGTCQKWFCTDCLECKGENKDGEHTCNDEKKASVALIIKDTKPCPKCGERISKVDGCDQMWCTTCHTAFSWKSGLEINGVIHNPHYYEFQRRLGGGVAPRNPGDVPCGGLPYYYVLSNNLRKISRFYENIILSIHRITAEIQGERLETYQARYNINDNGDLGVKYLLKEMDKDAMKSELVKRERKRLKHAAIRAVLEMFVNTSIIMLNDIVNNPPKNDDDIKEIIKAYENLKKYANDSLTQISKMKGCSVPQIGDSNIDNWRWIPFSKYSPPEESNKKKKVKKEESDKKEETETK